MKNIEPEIIAAAAGAIGPFFFVLGLFLGWCFGFIMAQPSKSQRRVLVAALEHYRSPVTPGTPIAETCKDLEARFRP